MEWKGYNSVNIINVLGILIIVFIFCFFIISETKKQKETNYYELKNGIFTFKFEDARDRVLYSKNFKDASDVWNKIIQNKVEIDVFIIKSKRYTNILAETKINDNDVDGLTKIAEIRLNGKSFDNLSQSDKTLIIRHELGHVLGIGLKWIIRYDETNGSYIGREDYPLTMNAYIESTGTDNNLGIPIEKSGGRGVAHIHWENNDRDFDGDTTKGIPNDLMVSSLDYTPIISLITLANLRDLGWGVDTSYAQPINYDLPRKLISRRVDEIDFNT
jgi:hypothetical protein